AKNSPKFRISFVLRTQLATLALQIGQFRGKRLNIELGWQVVNSGQIYSSCMRKTRQNRPSTSRLLSLLFNNPSSEVNYTGLKPNREGAPSKTASQPSIHCEKPHAAGHFHHLPYLCFIHRRIGLVVPRPSSPSANSGFQILDFKSPDATSPPPTWEFTCFFRPMHSALQITNRRGRFSSDLV